MAKTIGLQQLANKVFDVVKGMPEKFVKSIGGLESAFDAVIWGDSGNGKSSFCVDLIKELILAMDCKCEYVAYEEGTGLTMQDLMIGRNDLYNVIGNKLQITDHLTFDELHKKMGKKQSAKIWVIDSLQAAGFTAKQCAKLKDDYVLSRKKKIIIYISWAEGKEPAGAAAKSAKYYAHIKMYIKDFIMFPRSRYGGNMPYVIWKGDEKQGALAKWGREYYKISGEEKPKRVRKPKASKEPEQLPPPQEPVTNMQILPEETPEEKQEAMLEKLKSTNNESIAKENN